MTYPDVLGLLIVTIFILCFYYLSLRYVGPGPSTPRAPRRTFQMPPIPKAPRYEWEWSVTYPTQTEGPLVVIAATAEFAMKFANRTDTPVDLGPPKDPSKHTPGHRRWGFGLNTERPAASE